MNYLKLELQRIDGAALFSAEVNTRQFDPIVHSFHMLLTEQNVLAPEEKCRARIVPHFDDNPSFGKPVVLAAAPSRSDDQQIDDPYVDTAITPDRKITYFAIELHATVAETMYRFDVRLETLFGGLITKTVQDLLDKGSLSNGERFRLLLSPSKKTNGRPRKLPALKVKSKETVKKETEIVLPAPQESPVGEDFDIKIDSVEQMVTPQPKSMKSYVDVETVGTIANDDIPIFIQRDAMKVAVQSAGSSVKSNEEVGGFLLGSVFRDPEDDRLFVEINEAVETDRARGTYVSLEFNYDAWRQVLDRIENSIRDKVLVGWYHTHLVSLAAAVPIQDSNHEYVARYMTFFSQHDIFIHRNFFPSAWHVGLVMDLRCKAEVFFAWKSGQIAGTRGFYLYGQ